MPTIMKKLSQDHRLQGFSLPEIIREWSRLTLDLAEAGVEDRGRKLKPGVLLNAVVLYYMRQMGPQMRLDIARWGLEELERSLVEPGDEESSPPPGEVELDVKTVTDPKASKPRGQRKKGS